jgi:hypothetical protein
MKRARFSEEQIIAILAEAESDVKAAEHVDGTESRTQRSASGGASMAVWRYRRCTARDGQTLRSKEVNGGFSRR